MSQNPRFVKINKCERSQIFKNRHRKRGKTTTFSEVSTFTLNLVKLSTKNTMILQYLQVKTENGISLIEIHSPILVVCGRKNRVSIFKSQKSNILTKRVFVLFYVILFVLWKFSWLLNSLESIIHPTWMCPWICIKVGLSPSKNIVLFSWLKTL